MDITRAHRGLADVVRRRLDGSVLTRGQPGYDEARSPFFSHRRGEPVVVVRPAHAADVAATVELAQQTGLPLAVRSGGHSSHSTGDGILLDLGSLTRIDLDADAGTLWADAGLTAGEVSRRLSPHGLAVGFGDTASVGVGGISLGGGIGFLSRLTGLTVDNVLAAEVVTADGEIRVARADHEPDLFWAIRGGGGNFGVVTRFRYRAARLPDVYGGLLVLPARRDTIAGLVAAAEAADERVTAILNVMGAPPLPLLPAHVHGSLVVAARICFAGDPGEGETALRPFREIATPVADLLQPLPYAAMLEDAPDRGQRPAIRTMFVERVGEEVAGTVLDHLSRASSWLRLVQIRVLGGAVGRVAADATAFAHRSSRILVNLVHGAETGEAAATGWVQGLRDALEQDDAGAYVNFLGPDEDHRVAAAYPGATLQRLRGIKATLDPDNVFRSNVNIPPAAHDAAGGPPRDRF